MKAIVVEDSRVAREGLMSMLAAYPDIELVGSADHPDTAMALIGETRIDVLFLDIHMPGSSGFELLENLDYEPLVIFTTAYSEHAIRSFDYKTIDYLLKPISRERLRQAISKLRNHLSLVSSAQESDPFEQQLLDGQLTDQVLDKNSRMFIRDNDKCYLVDLDSIRYFESCKNYARLYFGENKAFIKRSLNHLEQRLPHMQFFRANRQYIVNLHSVKTVEETINDGCYLTLDDNKEIDVSRRNLIRLKELLSF